MPSKISCHVILSANHSTGNPAFAHLLPVFCACYKKIYKHCVHSNLLIMLMIVFWKNLCWSPTVYLERERQLFKGTVSRDCRLSCLKIFRISALSTGESDFFSWPFNFAKLKIFSGKHLGINISWLCPLQLFYSFIYCILLISNPLVSLLPQNTTCLLYIKPSDLFV